MSVPDLTIPDLTKAKPGKFPPLDDVARERLKTLLDELIDMNIALERLISGDNSSDFPAAHHELRRAMDLRLTQAINLVAIGDEEG